MTMSLICPVLLVCLHQPGAEVMNKFYCSVTMQCRNKELQLVKTYHITCYIQSEYFMSTNHRFAMLKFVCNIDSRGYLVWRMKQSFATKCNRLWSTSTFSLSLYWLFPLKCTLGHSASHPLKGPVVLKIWFSQKDLFHFLSIFSNILSWRSKAVRLTNWQPPPPTATRPRPRCFNINFCPIWYSQPATFFSQHH